MNCDDAFDCLTDPARRHSDELKWHLDLCARCRQMQEVLSPALHLLVPPADSGEYAVFPRPVDESGLDLEQPPANRPVTLPAESIRLAEQTAAELARQSREHARLRRRRFGSVTRYVALMLLVAVITFAGTTWSNRRADRAAVTPPDRNERCLWTEHKAAEKKSPRRTSRQVVLSCVECHLGRSFE